ncbi:protein FD [Nicotiana tomentosiformis]|uniref:protein FD n=1 Tax=Nicotiana tomentosiformis TaxID=4098 RepID=UPI00051C72B8|nr:protein FD-like [Nicotiana tomentosiformis]XP_018625990.1 protein FD-like [Nicotiana tomentosiformis]XP_018625991.1 protein FD-like [Nicotiana tomentosiformis]
MSSSTSSFSSSRTPTSNNHRLNNKTMEEVWKDINLSSLNDHTTSSSRDHILDPQENTSNSTNFGGMILQDFLARPFANNPQTAAKGYVSPAPPPPPAVTVLTLNSGPGLHFFGNLRQNSSSQQQKATISSRSFEALASPVGGNTNGRKRCGESENNSSDQKNKRMIKNRESAARSRARKQAYTNELELKVAHLMEENARLKKQQQQLWLAAAAQLPKKNSLYRTSTAPF